MRGHMINGNDGGIYVTWDGGKDWDFQNQMAVSQLYSVDVDMRKPYYIYGGVQDYCTWGGPSATRKSVGIQLADWFKVQTGDGFQARVDPTDYTIVYAESQNGGLVRHDLKSGRNTAIKPRAREGQPAYRFNWETPILVSSHDHNTLYVGGNFVFKSTDRGDAWTAISPELPTAKAGTITTIGESPLDAAVLYAGTDDGNVYVTRDGGKNWTNVTAKFPGMPGRRWVSRVVASRYDKGAAYVAFDGHRNDDYATYLFKTTDFGERVEVDQGRPARRDARARDSRGREEPAPAVRRHRGGRLRFDRRRPPLGAAHERDADRAGRRPDRASARRRSDCRDAWAQLLRDGHLAARGTDAAGACEPTRTCSR